MRSYKHFTMDERVCLQTMYSEGRKISEISKTLGRACSSVSRELMRNRNKDNHYNAYRGHCLYVARRRKCKPQEKLAGNEVMREWFSKKIKRFWSPEQCVHQWNASNVEDKISVSTIYRAIYQKLLPDISAKEHLRRHGKKACAERSKYNTIKPDHTIHERDQIIEERGRVGDWEGDTVRGSAGKGGVLTLVDRKSRFVKIRLLLKLDKVSTSKAVREALREGAHTSLTLDNGSEFADFRNIESDMNTPIYFADPHAPWQRGTNENTNDLIRFFFPKGTDFTRVPPEKVAIVEKTLNDRPRKCLGWKTPAQVFADPCCT